MIHWIILWTAMAIVVAYHAVVITGIFLRERKSHYRPPRD